MSADAGRLRGRCGMKLDLSEHRLTVLHDAGDYRHLVGRRPTTWMYGFNVVTWPYYLALTGDLGHATFSINERNVLPYFTGSQYDYWAEKAEFAGTARVRGFSATKATQALLDHYGDSHPIELPRLIADLHKDMEAQEYGEVVESHGLSGVDTYEVLDCGRILDPHFKRVCDAVEWTRQQYVAAQGGAA